MSKIHLSAGLILVSQMAFAQRFPEKCLDELMNIPNTKEKFVLDEFLKELPATVLKIKAQAKTGEIPVIGFFFGPGSDDKVTDIGITVGCAKAFPENPSQMLSLLKDAALKMAKGTATGNRSASSYGSSKISSDDVTKSKGEFTDPRDGKLYKTIIIGERTWMAENINYAVEGSRCYDDNADNCAKYGRLYNWTIAMAFNPSCNSSACQSQIRYPSHQGICPKGWHISSDADWNELFRYINDTGGKSIYYGMYLKSKSGWYSCGPSNSGSSFLCEDAYGFSALPGGGYSHTDGNFSSIGDYGGWWNATESSTYYAYYNNMRYISEYAHRISLVKKDLRSVRCVQD